MCVCVRVRVCVRVCVCIIRCPVIATIIQMNLPTGALFFIMKHKMDGENVGGESIKNRYRLDRRDRGKVRGSSGPNSVVSVCCGISSSPGISLREAK